MLEGLLALLSFETQYQAQTKLMSSKDMMIQITHFTIQMQTGVLKK